MSSKKLVLIPLMLCFFAMGFVDLVGIASNYVKEDLQLTDSVANVFPSLVFFWFLIFSVPTGILMNKIGLVFLLVVSKPKALPLRLVDFHRLLLLVAYGGHEEYLAVLGLEGIDLVDHVERLLGCFTTEKVDLLLGMGGHYGVVFLRELGAEVVDMGFVMVVLHHVEVHADILL